MPAVIESVHDQELLARKMKSILGEASAAALALAELEERRAAGEDVIIFSTRGRWLVGSEEFIVKALNEASTRRHAARKQAAL